MSSRNKNCYICGNPFHAEYLSPKHKYSVKSAIIDRRERKAHSDCLKSYYKAQKELAEQSWSEEDTV